MYIAALNEVKTFSFRFLFKKKLGIYVIKCAVNFQPVSKCAFVVNRSKYDFIKREHEFISNLVFFFCFRRWILCFRPLFQKPSRSAGELNFGSWKFIFMQSRKHMSFISGTRGWLGCDVDRLFPLIFIIPQDKVSRSRPGRAITIEKCNRTKIADEKMELI